MNHCLSRLGGEVPEQELDLARHELLAQRHEDVRRAEVAVVLRDLVLEDQVVAEGVPGQLGDEPVVLMAIGAGVREDDVGGDARAELVEELLELGPDVREVRLAERAHDDLRTVAREGRGARARLPLAPLVGTGRALPRPAVGRPAAAALPPRRRSRCRRSRSTTPRIEPPRSAQSAVRSPRADGRRRETVPSKSCCRRGWNRVEQGTVGLWVGLPQRSTLFRGIAQVTCKSETG